MARKLEARLGVPVRLAMRLWRPYPKEVLTELAGEGIGSASSSSRSRSSRRTSTRRLSSAPRSELAGATLKVTRAEELGTRARPSRMRSRTRSAGRSQRPPPSLRPATLLLMTAHSLPLQRHPGGRPLHGDEVRASAAAIARDLGTATPAIEVAFQSQGMGGGQWLGPDLPAALEAARASGTKHVLVAPIGFLADHVEILYDLDIEAKALAAGLGLTLARTHSLNASDGLIKALENVARPLLG